MPSKPPRRYNYFSLRFKHTSPNNKNKNNNNRIKNAPPLRKPFSEACARFLKVDGFVFVTDGAADATTFDVVCHVRADTTAPNFIRTIARWNEMTQMVFGIDAAPGQHGVYPQKIHVADGGGAVVGGATGERWVLPVATKRLSAQVLTNPVLKRVKEAQVGKEGRVGSFLFMEDQDEPTVKARYSPVEKLLMPESRGGY